MDSERTTGRDTDVVIAIDVGGTGIKCALVNAGQGAPTQEHDRGTGATISHVERHDTGAGTAIRHVERHDTGPAIRHVERHDTGAERGPDAVVATIIEVAAGLADRARRDGLTPRAAGIVTPGVIDEAAGVVVWAANVGFRSVPLKDLVEKELALPVALGHDVRAGALAEARLGAGRGVGRVWFIAIGTGIAAAYVRDGRTDPGAHGASGEIGHVVVRPGGPECACGLRGCVEAIGSAAAVARRHRERTGETVSAADVVARAAGGDAAATGVWHEAIDALADGLRIGVTLYDPDMIVVGGGLAEAGAVLLDPLTAALRDRLTFQTMPALVRAELGDEAGCLGAALLAVDLVTP